MHRALCVAWLAACTLGLTACDDDDPDMDTASPTAPLGQPPSSSVTSTASLASGGPYPSKPTPRPSKGASRPPVEGLFGVTLSPDDAIACPQPADAILELAPARDDTGGEDLIAIARDAGRSVAGWRLSEALPPGRASEGLSGVRQVAAWTVDADAGTRPPVVAVRTELGEDLLLWIVDCGDGPASDLDTRAYSPAILAVLALEEGGEIAGADRVEIRLADWSGDGTQEALVGFGGSRTLFAQGAGPFWDAALSIESGAAVVDVDRDGRLEAVNLAESGLWQLQEWTGAAKEVAELPAHTPEIPSIDADALPALGTHELYLGGVHGDTWRWPAAGGALEHLDEGGRFEESDWTPWPETEPRSVRRSSDGRISVEYRADDVASTVEAVTHAAAIGPEATRVGAIHQLDPEGTGQGRPLVAVYEAPWADFGARGFMGLAVSPNGERLAWSDGLGLWVLPLPEGRPRRLTEWVGPGLETEDNIRGLHRPVGWSAHGQSLLVEARYVEGGDYGVWFPNEEGGDPFTTIPGTFGYVDGYSEVDWLARGRLLHARSGGDFGGNASLATVDPGDPADQRTVHQAWPRLHEMASATVLGFAERPDGGLLFGLRSNLPFDADTNGLFVLGPQASEPARVTDLPVLPASADDPFTGGGLRCPLRFSPDGSAFLCQGRSPGDGTTRTYVGSVASEAPDGSVRGETWDATRIFAPNGEGSVTRFRFQPRPASGATSP